MKKKSLRAVMREIASSRFPTTMVIGDRGVEHWTSEGRFFYVIDRRGQRRLGSSEAKRMLKRYTGGIAR